MSKVSQLCHIVIRTKLSQPSINVQHEREMYAYIYKVSQAKKVHVYRIGGMPDHIHLLVDLPASLSLAEYLQSIKVATSKAFKDDPRFPNFRGWSKGYGSFSHHFNTKEVVINYIKNQKQHHKYVTFEEEYLQLIEEHGIDFNSDYFLKDDEM